MYVLNKIIGYLVSPMGISMALAGMALLALWLKRRRIAKVVLLVAVENVWLWATPWMTRWVGVPLEAAFLVDGRAPSVETLPQVDLIVLHGGSMAVATNLGYRAEIETSADRVWQAARLWKAGKAPKVLVLSVEAKLTSEGLLADLGVAKEGLVYDLKARNTEEEVKNVATSGVRRILVVTSAWHMKRTLLMYKKYAPNVEAIPAPCDFENTLSVSGANAMTLGFLPNLGALLWNSICFHEWLGYFGYKYLR